MEHIVKLDRGHDCARFECIYGSERCAPGEGGFHGRHGLNMRFVSKGEAGAVHFLLFTGWLPQHLESSSAIMSFYDWGNDPLPAELGYHSKTPLYDGQEAGDVGCEFCDGAPCYYAGSGLQAYNAMYTLVNGGGEALWKFLDEYYNSVFCNGKHPTPVEYKMKLRGTEN